MERTKILLVILLLVAAFALVFTSARAPTVADQSTPGLLPADQIKPAPDFTLPDAASGQLFHLADQTRTRPIVLDFWATWCGPCREELPHIQSLSKRYAGRVGFYGINSSDSLANITAFARQERYTFPMLSDARSQVATQYGANSIPLLIVIDTHGKVRSVTNGFDPDIDASLPKVLDALLAERRTPKQTAHDQSR